MTFLPIEEGIFAAVIDARIGGAYVLIGQHTGQHTEYLSKPSLVPIQEVGEALKATPKLVSPCPARLRKRLQDAYPHMTWQWEESGPSPTQMAILVQRYYERGQYSLDGQLELLYLRKTQAEIERTEQDK